MSVASWLWEINLLLAAFNLIPAAPLDGGRILRSGLWRAWRDRDRAAVLAARVGLGFGLLLVLAGAVELVRGSALGLWPTFLGWFLFSAARSEEGAAHLRERIEGLYVGDVMVQPPPMAPSTMTVAEVLAGHAPWRYGDAAALVSASGWLDGVVGRAAPPGRGPRGPVHHAPGRHRPPPGRRARQPPGGAHAEPAREDLRRRGCAGVGARRGRSPGRDRDTGGRRPGGPARRRPWRHGAHPGGSTGAVR